MTTNPTDTQLHVRSRLMTNSQRKKQRESGTPALLAAEPCGDNPMTTTDSSLTVEQLRRCGVCHELRRIVAKVGPVEIKEPCGNKCERGYVRKWKQEQVK